MDTFFVLDLDRTLLDTPRLTELYIEHIRQYDAQLAEDLIGQRHMYELADASFDAYSLVASRVDASVYERANQAFLDTITAEQVRMPGATELLGYLDAQQIRHGILTYGATHWQDIKLRAAQLIDRPYSLTHEKQKALTIAGWQRPDGRFDVPTPFTVPDSDNTFGTVVLVEDRIASFAGLPTGARGYWLHAPDDTEVLPQVTRIDTLTDSMTIEHNRGQQTGN